MQLAGVVRGCCKGPLGQPLQGKGGCYHLCCIGRIFVSMWEEDSLFSTARQCYLPARLKEAVSRKVESLFTRRKLKSEAVACASAASCSHGRCLRAA